MTLEKLISLLNEDLSREYQHMLFYTHAANVLIGPERLYFADKLKEHAASEMQHVFQFAQKIRANGGTPISGLQSAPFTDSVEQCRTLKQVIGQALALETEVVNKYHERHKQASELHAATGLNYDLVIFLEEQIEHSQGDIDELTLVAAGL